MVDFCKKKHTFEQKYTETKEKNQNMALSASLRISTCKTSWVFVPLYRVPHASPKLPASLGRPGTASAGGLTGGSTCNSGLAGEAEGKLSWGTPLERKNLHSKIYLYTPKKKIESSMGTHGSFIFRGYNL